MGERVGGPPHLKTERPILVPHNYGPFLKARSPPFHQLYFYPAANFGPQGFPSHVVSDRWLQGPRRHGNAPPRGWDLTFFGGAWGGVGGRGEEG